MSFTQVQVFAIAVILGACFGAYRGWRREVITLAIELATIIFLLLHGVETIAGLSSGASSALVPTASALGLSGGGGATNSNAGGGTYTPGPTVVCTNPINLQMVEFIIFGVMTFLAYRLGWAWGGAHKGSNDRIIGFFVGAVNGAAIMFYLSKTVFQGQTITLFSPSGWQAGQYLPLIIAGAFIAIVILLLIGTQSRRSGSAGGAH
jgi:hypothetical protein